jgi:hypothetical protein
VSWGVNRNSASAQIITHQLNFIIISHSSPYSEQYYQRSNDSSVVTYPHQQQIFVDCDQLHQQPMKRRRIKDSYGMGDYISTGEIIAFDENEKKSIEVLKKRKICIPAQKIRIPASVQNQKRQAARPELQSTDPNMVLKREKRKLYLSRMCPEELEHYYSVLPFFLNL